MRALGLHQITAMEAGPVGLVRIAAETGCSHVCIFTQLPAGVTGFPVITTENSADFTTALRETGVRVGNVEFFPITPGIDLETYSAGLALGAEIGGERIVTHVHDTDETRAVDTLGRLCDMAAGLGLKVGLEFMGLSPGCDGIAKAAWYVGQVGRPNLGIAVDALHLARTGGTPADVAALPARVFAYSQICDAHGLHRATDYLPEALDREMPGDGDLPLAALIDALPAATFLDVEVPRANLTIPALERAREAVARTRALLAAARPLR